MPFLPRNQQRQSTEGTVSMVGNKSVPHQRGCPTYDMASSESFSLSGICSLVGFVFSSLTLLVLPFWYWLTWVVPDKGPLNSSVCVSYWLCEQQLKLLLVMCTFPLDLFDGLPALL